MALLDQVFASAKPTIEATAKRAREQHPSEPLAILLKQGRNGKLEGGCLGRADALAHVEKTIKEPARKTILAELERAPSTVIPVVLLVRGSAGIEFGIVYLTPPTAKPPGFRVDEEQTLARFLATEIKAKPGETVSAWVNRAWDWAEANKEHPHASAVLQRDNDASRFFTLGWTIAWGMNACPRVIVPHKLGAALMATNPGDDSGVMTCAPWDAYTIEIPPELVRIEIEGRWVSFDVICVWRNLDGENHMFVNSRSSGVAFGGKLTFPVADFVEEGAWSADATAMTRATECLQRMVIGTELEMSDPTNVRAPRPPRRNNPGNGTSSSVHQLIRPITIDCREAMSEYIAGNRKKSLTLRSLVRGHWKQQAHGPGWSLRRWLHVAPYWKGPAGAPVAIRPHRLREEE